MDNMDTSILTMQVKLSADSEVVSLDLSKDMLINVADINESYVDQPARYAYWATMATFARSKANKIKQRMDREQDYIKTTLTGTLDSKVRIQLELDGEKITETKVMNAIYTHPEYISCKAKLADLQDQFAEADEQARMLEVGKETMNQRKEMLISLGAQLRNEYNGVSDFWVKKEEDPASNIRDIIGQKKSNRVDRRAILSEK